MFDLLLVFELLEQLRLLLLEEYQLDQWYYPDKLLSLLWFVSLHAQCL